MKKKMSRFKRSWPILNRLRYRFRMYVADLFEERKIISVSDLVNEEPLKEPRKQMTEDYRHGMTDILSAHPEAIQEDVVKGMISDLIYISKLEQGPEAAPSIDRVWDLCRQLGKTYKSALLAQEQLDRMK